MLVCDVRLWDVATPKCGVKDEVAHQPVLRRGWPLGPREFPLPKWHESVLWGIPNFAKFRPGWRPVSPITEVDMPVTKKKARGTVKKKNGTAKKAARKKR